MKKILFLMISIVLIVALGSCEKGVTTVLFKDKDSELADARMEQVFTAIKKQDKDALMKAFSKKSLAEAKNIDISVDYLVSFFQGQVVSWNRDEAPIVSDSVEDGRYTKQLVTWYTLYTDEQEYLVFLVDYPLDEMNPENIGLYTLMLIRAEDENKLIGSWQDWVIPGITHVMCQGDGSLMCQGDGSLDT